MTKTKQEKIVEMIADFQKLGREDQMYVSGIVKGISLQKEIVAKTQHASA